MSVGSDYFKCPIQVDKGQLSKLERGPTGYIKYLDTCAYIHLVVLFQLEGQKVPIEVHLMLMVAHVPGVVKILDYYEKSDSFVVVMERRELVKDLFDFITENGPLPEEVARDFFHQIVDTVLEIHKAGVVHLDVKDENILIDLNTGKLQLIDFGSGAYLKEGVYTEFEGNSCCCLLMQNSLCI